MDNLNLAKYYDMGLALSFVPSNKRNLTQLERAIKKLEADRNRSVREHGITEYAVQLQEVISQLYIDLKEAKNEDYSANLQNLEYILAINIKWAEKVG